MKKLKIVSFLMVLILLLGALMSCAGGKDGDKTQTGDASADQTGDLTVSTDPDETERNALNILGERDLGGETITFYLRSYGGIWDVKSLYADTILSDAVNDAVYERNEHLKEVYNFDIQMQESLAQSYPTRIITLVLSGACGFDVLTAGGYDMTKIAVQGVLRDLAQVDGLSLENEWWNTTLNDQMTIANTLYYMSGDLMCEDNMAVRCMFFNKTLATNHGFAPEMIYDLAQDGKWTMEEMFGMASKCYSDKDDVDGKSEDDMFGFVAQKTSAPYVLMTAAGIRVTEKDVNDIPVLTLGQGNDTDIIDQISAWFYRDNSVFLEGDGLVHKAFKSNSALFMTEVLGTVASMRNWDVKFGILPMPKYSEEQQTYNHYADGNCLNLLAIPTGNDGKLDKIAFVLEAMCIESANTLNPAFYDRCLRGRYSYDMESAEMIDIILGSMFIENNNLFRGENDNEGWGLMQREIIAAVSEGRSISPVIASYRESTTTKINNTAVRLKDISIAQSYTRGA